MAQPIEPYADPGYLTLGQTPRWPLNSESDVLTAWTEFTDEIDTYPQPWRGCVEDRIRAAATRFTVHLPDDQE